MESIRDCIPYEYIEGIKNNNQTDMNKHENVHDQGQVTGSCSLNAPYFALPMPALIFFTLYAPYGPMALVRLKVNMIPS